MKKKDKLLVVRITAEMLDKLNLIADKKDTSRSELVRRIIAEVIKESD